MKLPEVQLRLKDFPLLALCLTAKSNTKGNTMPRYPPWLLYGPKTYSPKTISSWYSDCLRYGLDALKPKPKFDKGGTHKVTTEISDALAEKCKKYPEARQLLSMT